MKELLNTERSAVAQLKAIIKAHDTLRNRNKTAYLPCLDYQMLSEIAVQCAAALQELNGKNVMNG